METNVPTVYTIGHSNHHLEKFLSLLESTNIGMIVDIRSRPYSRFASQFNKAAIEKSLRARGISYLYSGDKLGGRPDDKRFYDNKGNVVYSRISDTPEFRASIELVIKGAGEYRQALMCAEENPLNCHRYQLVSGFLEKSGAKVIHIRGDGRHQSGDDLASENEVVKKDQKQLKLF